MTQYRIRRSVAIGTSATAPLIGAIVLVAVLRPVWLGVIVGTALAVALIASSVRRVRRRTLTVSVEGLAVQRDKYRLVVPWDAITSVQHRRHQWIMRVDELVCTGARVEPVDSRGRAGALPKGLAEHPAMTRVMVSLYSKDWRAGPIGEKVALLGMDG